MQTRFNSYRNEFWDNVAAGASRLVENFGQFEVSDQGICNGLVNRIDRAVIKLTFKKWMKSTDPTELLQDDTQFGRWRTLLTAYYSLIIRFLADNRGINRDQFIKTTAVLGRLVKHFDKYTRDIEIPDPLVVSDEDSSDSDGELIILYPDDHERVHQHRTQLIIKPSQVQKRKHSEMSEEDAE